MDSRAPVSHDVGVLIENGLIRQVAKFSLTDQSISRNTEVVALDGLVLPGFVDAHSHLRGLALSEQGVPDIDLESWLLRLRTVTQLDVADEALVAAGDLLAAGVTAVQGVLHSFAGRDEYLDQVQSAARALDATGISAELMIGLTDQAEYSPASPCGAGPERGMPVRQLRDLVSVARRSCPGKLTRVGVAPVAPQWCSDSLLAEIRALRVAGVRVHTHLLESSFQRGWISEDPVSRLRRWDLLGPALSAAHGVWLAADEVAELASRRVTVVHCPSSNAGLRVGTAPVARWRRAGLSVALGLDSHPIDGRVDMLAEMRAAVAAAGHLGDPLTGRQALGLATVGGAAAIGRSGQIGRIAAGYRADLIAASAVADEETAEGFLAAGSTADIHEVICAGRRLVSGGRLHCAAEVEAARARSRQRLAADQGARAARQSATGKQVRELRQLLTRMPWGGA